VEKALIDDQTIAAPPATREQFLRRAIAVTLGAFVVALSAQFEIPSRSPDPDDAPGAALILVGFVLGPRYGALALVTYVTMGLPDFPYSPAPASASSSFWSDAAICSPSARRLWPVHRRYATGIRSRLVTPGALRR